jgi:hypothetical protein
MKVTIRFFTDGIRPPNLTPAIPCRFCYSLSRLDFSERDLI